jgi:CRISPR-associated protein Csh1
MLDTLYAIGKEISQDRDSWEDIILVPSVDDKEGKLKLYNLKVVFDLDQKTIILAPEYLETFSADFHKLKSIGNLKIQGGQNKSIYVSCAAEKMEQLAKTLFGKKGTSTGKGEFMEAIDMRSPGLKNSLLYQMLSAIYPLSKQFSASAWDEKKEKYDTKLLQEPLRLGAADRLVLIYAAVTSAAHGLHETPLAQVEGYTAFIESKFFGTAIDANSDPKMCYATGELQNNVKEAEFGVRYNINKLFVKTTQNFANNFDKDAFGKNYQLSEEAEIYLDRGSDFVLNKKKLVTKIANVPHAIIPRFFRQEDLDVVVSLDRLTRETDLLFKLTDLEKLSDYLDQVAEKRIYWLNFLAIDSDGNYFKVSNQILDVPNFFCMELINAFKLGTKVLKPWLGNQALNFYSLFDAIPIRKNERNNRALLLFAQILERRKVDRQLIFKHFKDLALCHWFERYRGYDNIRKPQIDNFDFAIKDGVFRYLGFLYVLNQLNLIQNPITMKEGIEPTAASNIAEDIQAFFATLQYSDEQQALFYLGRALNQIAYAQEKKGHNKRILEKINFNGMDSKHITRLSTELFEKAMQHDVLSDAQWNLAEFNRRFNPEHWNLNPQEATFYLLSGYTYGIKSKIN